MQVANAAHKYCEIGSLIWKRSNLSVGKRANLHANAHFRCCCDQLMLQFIAHLQFEIELIVHENKNDVLGFANTNENII